MIRPTTHTLKNLADVVAVVGARGPDVEISGLVTDNRTVRPGDAFVAVPGVRVHGARFVQSAIDAGAVAIITDAAGAELVQADVPMVVLEDVASAVGPMAGEFYDHPTDRMTSYGITGTNGKTTTAFMIDHIVVALGQVSGLVGTVAIKVDGEQIDSQLTTPQPADLQAIAAAAVERGGEAFVMEVSSHAIAQGRTSGIRFSVAGFTNLTADHLDFHPNIEDYFETKARLFTDEHSQAKVVTTDSEYGRELFSRIATDSQACALGVFEPVPAEAQHYWQVCDVAPENDHTRFTMTNERGETISTLTTMPGSFNVANAALAIAMIERAGVPLAELREALEAVGGVSAVVPGRMEMISSAPRVIVDFAHNEDALAQATASLRPTTAGKLIVITGSAGDRDKAKRPGMARVVAEHGDRLIVTDDDPHSEDPATIRREVMFGIPDGFPFEEIPNREEAILTTIRGASPDDTVLVAGRGHETVQEVGGVNNIIDDREVARRALAMREENKA